MSPKALVFLILLGFIISVEAQNSYDILTKITNPNFDEARKKKKRNENKYLVPLLFGSLLVKSIIFPIAFKAMAVMSSISVLTSTMSLIISSIIGFVRLAVKAPTPSFKVVHKLPYTNWAKDDSGNENAANLTSTAWRVPPWSFL